jgi:AbiJ N-terminal domain 4
MTIFDLFSKRGKSLPDVYVYDDLPPKLRVQVIHILKDTLCKVEEPFGEVSTISFDKIHRIVCEEHGVFHLADQRNSIDDVLNCILNREDVALVLDVIETASTSCG